MAQLCLRARCSQAFLFLLFFLSPRTPVRVAQESGALLFLCLRRDENCDEARLGTAGAEKFVHRADGNVDRRLHAVSL